jgi:CheY-like chemotaxis protein
MCGTGLGLAISKRLCEMMGGTIWAESPAFADPNRGVEAQGGPGSTFRLKIQAKVAHLPPSPYLRPSQPALSGGRVLIVDDNVTNRQILTLQTQAWGIVPRATAHPTEALAWIRCGELFDVAILDMHMPEMDGLMLAAEIRRVPDAGVLPLVMLTSGQRGSGEEESDSAAFLTKPVKASLLYNVLVSILAGDAQPIDRPDHRYDGQCIKRGS